MFIWNRYPRVLNAILAQEKRTEGNAASALKALKANIR
jgi:hypothetical protein